MVKALMRWPRNPYARQIFILAIMLAAMIGAYVAVYSSDPDTERGLERVVEAWDKVHANPFNGDDDRRLIYASIRGMLQTLDPHTHFLDEETYRYMKQEQEGGFYGIGISFDVRNGVLMVVSPIEGTPAWDAGIRAGDRIVKIEGKPTIGITTSEVINSLRGKRGSKVTITVQREGSDDMRDVTLMRDKIPLKSVRNPLILNHDIGYIRLNSFAQNTDQELREAWSGLKAKGAHKLILDLRFNSGGLLTAAQQVSQQFLSPGKEIVQTRGRLPGSTMEIKAEDEKSDVDTPLIVLVNQYSASASEIVAGAIQDHDRGLIIGEVTFGKGLVGSLYPLSENTALQITTAQYYTASGRYIQKPYDIPHRAALGSDDQPLFKGSRKEGEKKVYATDNGRKVFGGGGITPDVLVEEPKLTEIMRKLENASFDFSVQYVNSGGAVTETMTIKDDIIEQFTSFLHSHSIAYDEAAFKAELVDIKHELKRQLISVAVSADAGYLYSLEYNPMVQKALELFPQFSQLLSQGAASIGAKG